MEQVSSRNNLRKLTEYTIKTPSVMVGQFVNWKPKDLEWAGRVGCIHPATKKEGLVAEKQLRVESSIAHVLVKLIFI